MIGGIFSLSSNEKYPLITRCLEPMGVHSPLR